MDNKTENILTIIIIFILSIFITWSIYTIYSLESRLQFQQNKVKMYRNKYDSTKKQLNTTKQSLLHTIEELENLRSKFNETRQELNETERELERSEVYYIPTPEKIEDVVQDTDIDDNEYSDDYDCTEYSYDLIEEFNERSIDACGVEVSFADESAHIFVAVNTTEGVRYVEPQDDTVFEEISLGEDYCDIVNWNCNWTVSKVSSCYDILKV